MGSRGPIAKGQKLGHRTKAELERQSGLSLVTSPAGGVPRAPVSLGESGKASWKAAYGSAPWIFGDESSEEALERYCQGVDERAELRELIEQEGRTAKGSMGQLVEHPHAAALRQVEAGLARQAQTLGLGPANRAKLGLPPVYTKPVGDDVQRLRQKIKDRYREVGQAAERKGRL